MNPLAVNRLTPLMDFYLSPVDSALFTKCLELAEHQVASPSQIVQLSLGFQSLRMAGNSNKVKEVKSGLPK